MTRASTLRFTALLLISSVALMSGCSSSVVMPTPPKAPQTRLQTVAEALNTQQMNPMETVNGTLPNFRSQVVALVEVGGTNGKEQFANRILAALIRRQNDGIIQVADRSVVDKAIEEAKIRDGNYTGKSDLEKAKTLRELHLLTANYQLFAAVGEFSNTYIPVQLRQIYLSGERERYARDHAQFQSQAIEAERKLRSNMNSPIVITAGSNADAMMQYQELMQLKARVKSPDDFDRETSMYSEQQTIPAVMATISAKLIDPTTNAPVWVYENSVRDTEPLAAFGRLTEALMGSLLKNTVGTATPTAAPKAATAPTLASPPTPKTTVAPAPPSVPQPKATTRPNG